MKYRPIKSTDLNVSVIGIGTHQFCGAWGKPFKQDEVTSILARASELGINLIDTAPNYGNHDSEKLIGGAIRNNRDKWIIASKFGQYLVDEKNTLNFSKNKVVEELDNSLLALNTDYIDILQFHSGDNQDIDNEKLWDELLKQQKNGKIRCLGISVANSFIENKDYTQVKFAKDRNIGVIQLVYNRLSRIPEEFVMPFCKENGISIIARVPLSKGFLSGKYGLDHKFERSDIRSSYLEELNLKLLQETQEIKDHEVPTGINMAQWALAWCLRDEAVVSVIPGCKSAEQLEFNAGAIGLL